MRKKIAIAIVILGCITSYAQVGFGTNAPKSTVDVNGSFATKLTEVINPNSYTLDATHQTIVFRGTGGTISIPAANTCQGREYTLVNFATGNILCGTTLFDAGTGTINFIPSMTIFKIKSNGTSWIQVDKTTTPADGSETKVNAGTGISVTGAGTIASPYVVNSTITQADGSETKVNAGTGVSVTGSGTTGSPYVVNSTITQANGSETKVNAGTGVSVTGSGTSAAPYVVNSTITQADGSETIVNTGTGLSKTGTGTSAAPYNVDLNTKVKFFYMPSISIDLTQASNSTNLYTQYKAQFQTPMSKNPSAASSIPYFANASDLDYYITYYDNTVLSNVTLTDAGLLTYNVISPATGCTFINVVFVVK